MYVIWEICIGILAGFLAGKIMRGTGFGLLGDLVIGVIGSLLGGSRWRRMPGMIVVRLDPVSISRRIGIAAGAVRPIRRATSIGPEVRPTCAGQIRWVCTWAWNLPMIHHG